MIFIIVFRVSLKHSPGISRVVFAVVVDLIYKKYSNPVYLLKYYSKLQ